MRFFLYVLGLGANAFHLISSFHGYTDSSFPHQDGCTQRKQKWICQSCFSTMCYPQKFSMGFRRIFQTKRLSNRVSTVSWYSTLLHICAVGLALSSRTPRVRCASGGVLNDIPGIHLTSGGTEWYFMRVNENCVLKNNLFTKCSPPKNPKFRIIREKIQQPRDAETRCSNAGHSSRHATGPGPINMRLRPLLAV